MSAYRSGPVRVNSGCEELIRPSAEVLLYPAAVSTAIMSCRVRSRSPAVSTTARYRSGTAVPGGACQWPSGPVVAPAAVSPAARAVADSGVRVTATVGARCQDLRAGLLSLSLRGDQPMLLRGGTDPGLVNDRRTTSPSPRRIGQVKMNRTQLASAELPLQVPS